MEAWKICKENESRQSREAEEKDFKEGKKMEFNFSYKKHAPSYFPPRVSYFSAFSFCWMLVFMCVVLTFIYSHKVYLHIVHILTQFHKV